MTAGLPEQHAETARCFYAYLSLSPYVRAHHSFKGNIVIPVAFGVLPDRQYLAMVKCFGVKQ